MTELSPVGTVTDSKDIVFGSCGVLLPNTQAKIVDLDDPIGPGLGSGKTGELWIKGPQVHYHVLVIHQFQVDCHVFGEVCQNPCGTAMQGRHATKP